MKVHIRVTFTLPLRWLGVALAVLTKFGQHLF